MFFPRRARPTTTGCAKACDLMACSDGMCLTRAWPPPKMRPLFWRAVSSAVEHCLHTAGVTGSIPVPPTNVRVVSSRTPIRFSDRAVSSAVEHCLHTAGVTGSIPVPPTRQETPAFGRRCPFTPGRATCRSRGLQSGTPRLPSSVHASVRAGEGRRENRLPRSTPSGKL